MLVQCTRPCGHWTHQNSVRVHWICLISLEKVNAHLLTSNLSGMDHFKTQPFLHRLIGTVRFFVAGVEMSLNYENFYSDKLYHAILRQTRIEFAIETSFLLEKQISFKDNPLPCGFKCRWHARVFQFFFQKFSILKFHYRILIQLKNAFKGVQTCQVLVEWFLK